MILDVAVTEYRHTITAHEIGLVRDRQTVSRLRKQYAPSWFSRSNQWQWKANLSPGRPPERAFQWYVDKYSEFTTQNPWDDVVLFLQRAGNAGLVQNLPTGRLLYPSYPIMNTAAMASAAEGLAGWFCESYYGWELVVRPPRVTPDMVFRDISSGRIALVEVKSSSRPGNPTGQLTSEMIKLLKVLAPTKLIRRSNYFTGLVRVHVEGPTTVNLAVLLLEEV